MSYLAQWKKTPAGVLDFDVRFGAADWVTATIYETGSVVRDPADDKYYQAKEGHTSGASRSVDSAKWKEIDRFWLDDANSELLSTATWTVPAGVTKDSDALSADKKVATIWLSGGPSTKTSYDLELEWTTDAGRTDKRTIKLTIEER